MIKSNFVVRTIALAGLTIAPLALASSAQALSFVSTQSAGEKSTSSLIGLNVLDKAGNKLGDINYLVLDTAGKVSTVVIGVGGFLGVGEKSVGVPYGELEFSADKNGKQVAVIDATKDSLSSAPNYVWTEKSAMDTLKEDAAELSQKAKDAAGIKSDKPSSSE